MIKKRIKSLTIRLDEDLYNAINKESIRTQNSISETIRTMLFMMAYQMKLN